MNSPQHRSQGGQKSSAQSVCCLRIRIRIWICPESANSGGAQRSHDGPLRLDLLIWQWQVACCGPRRLSYPRPHVGRGPTLLFLKRFCNVMSCFSRSFYSIKVLGQQQNGHQSRSKYGAGLRHVWYGGAFLGEKLRIPAYGKWNHPAFMKYFLIKYSSYLAQFGI